MAPSKQSHTVTKCKQSASLLHFEMETKRQRKKGEGKPKAYSQRSKPRKPQSAQNKGIFSPMQKALLKPKLATWGYDDHSNGSDVSSPLSSVQLFSCIQLFANPWTAARYASPSITNSRSLLKLMFIESVMPSNHIILCRPLLLPPSIFPSIRVFSNESALLIRWPKYWSFSFNISPSNEHPGLTSFKVDWLDLLAVQRTLKSLLQHHSSKASILWCSAFFIIQLSHPYMTTGKTIALTRWTFVGKVMSLLFSMLSRLVIASCLMPPYKCYVPANCNFLTILCGALQCNFLCLKCLLLWFFRVSCVSIWSLFLIAG